MIRKIRSLAEQVEIVRAYVLARKRNYQLTFENPVGKLVLRDLASFCRAGKTAWSEDPRHHARLQGRQEVWLRIQQHLNLPPAELWDVLGGVKDDHFDTSGT